jgi:hypothetical protein
MKSPVLKHLIVGLQNLGLRAYAGHGRTPRDFVIGPYVRVNNDRRKNIWQSRHKVALLLEQYYECNDPEDVGTRLILKRLGIFGSFLVVNQDADIVDLLPPSERAAKLRAHGKEFKRLGKYLASPRLRRMQHQ